MFSAAPFSSLPFSSARLLSIYVAGAGSATFSFTATGVGASTLAGVGASTFSFTTAGVGASTASGAGDASFSFTVAGAGASTAASAGSGSFNFTAAAIGASTAASAGGASFAFTGSGIGASTAAAVGAAEFSFTAVATAAAIFPASGSATFSFTAAGVSPTSEEEAADLCPYIPGRSDDADQSADRFAMPFETTSRAHGDPLMFSRAFGETTLALQGGVNDSALSRFHEDSFLASRASDSAFMPASTFAESLVIGKAAEESFGIQSHHQVELTQGRADASDGAASRPDECR